MNSTPKPPCDHRFAFGLLTGTFVGVGLALWLGPRAAELGGRLTRSAKRLGQDAADRYQEASSRAGEVVDELTRKGNVVRDDVANAVAHGAHDVAHAAREVERVAKAARS